MSVFLCDATKSDAGKNLHLSLSERLISSIFNPKLQNLYNFLINAKIMQNSQLLNNFQNCRQTHYYIPGPLLQIEFFFM